MKKILVSMLVILVSNFAFAEKLSIESLKSGAVNIAVDISKAEVNVPAPLKQVKEETSVVEQDIVYKFQRLKDDLWRFKNDSIWIRSDINRLESEARRIAQGQSSAFFQIDLRNISFNMSRYYNEINRLAMDLKNLLTLAKKDSQLNRLARDIEWDVMDLDNRFNFDVQNAAQSLEWTIRGIDPKIIGYDAQWTAMDISRYARDIAWKTRDMRWDAQKLVQSTQP